MKTLMKIVLMMVLVISPALATCAQEALWKELNAKFQTLYQQGRYTEAAKVAEEALKIAENTFAPEDLKVAVSLNNLANLYLHQGKYAEAELLIKRALAILEEALGPIHPDVADVLENMAELYKKTGREDEAKKMEERAKKIRSEKMTVSCWAFSDFESEKKSRVIEKRIFTA